MDFAEAHSTFIQEHISSRKGERRDRLERGHRHAEQLFLQQVWWPLMGSFQNLHPEYEVMDWHGRAYYADFCWRPGQVMLLIEIKGFQTHIRDMDRRRFSYELNRETFLYAMGFQVISFSYDDVEQQPQLCQHLLRMALGRYRQPAGNPDEADGAGDYPIRRATGTASSAKGCENAFSDESRSGRPGLAKLGSGRLADLAKRQRRETDGCV